MKKKVWFKEIGFDENPFNIKPAVYSDELEGYSTAIKKLVSGIKKGDVWFIEGPYGLGKTSILKNIINNFGGQKRLLYYSANRSEGGTDFKELLMGRTLFNKMFKVMPKDMILFLDEAQNMIRTDFEQIEAFIDAKNVNSVIFVSDDLKKVHFTPGMKKKLGSNVLRLSTLFGPKEAEKMIKKRIGNNKFMDAAVIKYVYTKSASNPRSLLENCEDLSKYVIDELAENKITLNHAKEFFKNK